ncbi:cobalamin biosynthesis protein CbiD [Candidatus Marsarchaeota G1 archaeon BE_D]|uniref:Cobalt-precorrin-5B C(1)-methyltransferase n=1 Tax=Candidatus Marsarchaeota G1 archaeon BE_D TaxID=1978156 RepID=A0A2R6AH59_9ARCH|nr:MAG: cobalamin biosynthesis protein CbiD [Candidatus Marsarchaeota G1 archaeon BE_D]
MKKRLSNPLVKFGLTTGSAAAAAAKAAALAAQGVITDRVVIPTPIGLRVELKVKEAKTIKMNQIGEAVVVKDAGENPDVTHGVRFIARVSLVKRNEIIVKAGEGIGLVTRPGLPVKPGERAINPIPLKMIKEAVSEALPQETGAEVEISVPEGKEVTKNTLNPKLGILEGISILGTTGIEEPVSSEEYLCHMKAQIDQAQALGHKQLALTPGNTGVVITKKYYNLEERAIVVVGDKIGEVLDHVGKKSFEELVVCGLPGKLVKLAAGVFNTHSKVADARFETLAALAALKGASRDLIKKILCANTVESTIDLLKEEELVQAVFQEVAERIAQRVSERLRGKLKVGALIASSRGFLLGMSESTKTLKCWKGLRIERNLAL